jgi:hypothetical protein
VGCEHGRQDAYPTLKIIESFFDDSEPWRSLRLGGYLVFMRLSDLGILKPGNTNKRQSALMRSAIIESQPH